MPHSTSKRAPYSRIHGKCNDWYKGVGLVETERSLWRKDGREAWWTKLNFQEIRYGDWSREENQEISQRHYSYADEW
jgi:hypothetical protein